MTYEFTAELWEYKGQGAWHFITLPKDYSEEIKMITSDFKNGFGSVKVEAKIESSTWQTSIFPDSKSGCYVLPVKKAVRTNENIKANDKIKVVLKILS